jgi:hypothetical protein
VVGEEGISTNVAFTSGDDFTLGVDDIENSYLKVVKLFSAAI